MSFITNITRSWLTRSFKPFTFTNKYDSRLFYQDCENLGLYVHLPFCRSICNFCPYCKVVYKDDVANAYVDTLLKEIDMVGSMQAVTQEPDAITESNHAVTQGRKKVTSLYFGGGSPALLADRIGQIVERLSKYFEITEGVGLELHPDDVNEVTLKKLKEGGVTKISIGIQSFQEKFQNVLGRKPVDAAKMQEALEKVPFETVSMDFIFALPGQNFDDLKADLEIAVKTGANHVAIYPFISFTFTKSTVPVMAKKEKRRLLDDITNYCASKGYERNSIWTFSTTPNTGYSSMTRDTFLGFGCSATTLLQDQFKVNTFSVEEYTKRVEKNELPTSLTIKFTLRQRMVYFLFWTAYSTRVPVENFEKFFGLSLKKMYGFEFWLAKLLGFVTYENGTYTMTLKGAFYYHYYENFYTLSYIDKMWGLMRKEAFPEGMEL